MPRLLLLPAILLLALPASAQPVLSDSTTRYVTPALFLGGSAGQGTLWAAGLGAGQRLASGVDVGVYALAGDLQFGEGGAFLSLGPTVGRSGRLGPFETDVRAGAVATLADLGGVDGGFALRTLALEGQATVGREVALGGSFRLVPTVGAYATLCTAPGLDPRPGTGCAEAGLLAGADLRFRVWGLDVSVPVLVRAPVLGNDDAGRIAPFTGVPPVSTGLRIRF